MRVIYGILAVVLLMTSRVYCADSLIPESQLKMDASVNSITNSSPHNEPQYKLNMGCVMKKTAYMFGGGMIGTMIGFGCYRLATGKPKPGDLTGIMPTMVSGMIGGLIGVLVGGHYADKLDCFRQKKQEKS